MSKENNLTMECSKGKNTVYVISAAVSKAVWIFSLFKMTERFEEKLNKRFDEL